MTKKLQGLKDAEGACNERDGCARMLRVMATSTSVGGGSRTRETSVHLLLAVRLDASREIPAQSLIRWSVILR